MSELVHEIQTHGVVVQAGAVSLPGNLGLPEGAHSLVLFAHGSGSSRFSKRNRYVAQVLHQAKFATLLMDLLTAEEEDIDLRTRQFRFNIELLAKRLVGATDWLTQSPATQSLQIGYFGASTGAAAALLAAIDRPEQVKAIVSRGGRPDLADAVLPQVKAPTLLIVGGYDFPVIGMNQDALALLGGEKQLEIVPHASHLFEEPGALEVVAQLATRWFQRHLS